MNDKKEKIKKILKEIFNTTNYCYNYWSFDDVAEKIAKGLDENKQIPEWESRFREIIKDFLEKRGYKPINDNINNFDDIICGLNSYDTIVAFFNKELKK